MITTNHTRASVVAQAFQPAGSGDFPVALPITELESLANSQTRMSALQNILAA
jgi:hypothetical protein